MSRRYTFFTVSTPGNRVFLSRGLANSLNGAFRAVDGQERNRAAIERMSADVWVPFRTGDHADFCARQSSLDPMPSPGWVETGDARAVDPLNTLNVLQLQRRAAPRQYSVERLFDDVRKAMPPDIQITLRINRFLSQGLFGRLYDVIAAWRRGADLNHVLGDIQYLACLLPRRRTIVTVLDCVSLERLTGMRRLVFWLFWYWLPLKGVARVTVISEFSGETLRNWVRYPADRIHVIPPTLSAEFQPSPWVPDLDRPRLLQIGTKSNKNLTRVIEAISGLRVTLVIVGSPDETARARMAALEIEYEEHLDLSRDELVEQYRRADVMVFASTYEGFGLPIIEAQAIGRPVVAGNVCAMPEAAGGAACMVDPLDTADIRRGICRVLEDPDYARSLVESGFENVQRYSPVRIANAYAEVYRLVSGTRKNEGHDGSSD